MQLEKTPIKSSFAWLQKVIDLTKQLPPEEGATGSGGTNSVKYGEELLEDQVMIAISAITEAVQYEYGSFNENGIPQRSLYNLMSITTLTNAKLGLCLENRPVDRACVENSRVARPRGTVMFPWVLDPEECASRTSSNDIKKAAQELGAHIILVTLDTFSNRLDIPRIIIHDSWPKYLEGNADLWRFVQSEIKMTVSTFGIFDYPIVRKISASSPNEVLFETEIVPAAIQGNGWACGVHAIPNAWAHVMSFTIDPGCRLDSTAYEIAVEIINLTIDGRASGKIIAVFLVDTGFVKYELNQRHRALRQGRINRYHNLRSWREVDERILLERIAFKERVKSLRARHTEGSRNMLVHEQDDKGAAHQPKSTRDFLKHRPKSTSKETTK